jgi:Lar family restriction alleviation protein
MSANQTASAPKLHPCHVCGRQPALLAENDDASFQCRCQCAEELSVGTGHFSTAEQAAAEWNRINEPSQYTVLGLRCPELGYLSEDQAGLKISPCPFCGCQPDLREFPISSAGLTYFIRCPRCAGRVIAETALQPSAAAAVAVWNTRAAKQQPFLLRQHVPFGLFCAGAFLFSVGAGFSGGAAGFFLSSGASVALSSLILAENVAESKEQA